MVNTILFLGNLYVCDLYLAGMAEIGTKMTDTILCLGILYGCDLYLARMA